VTSLLVTQNVRTQYTNINSIKMENNLHTPIPLKSSYQQTKTQKLLNITN